VNPALDAVTESKIATQNFDAEFGKAVSAVVTAQTKSGTNNFHGSAYDYRRSNANLARNPFTQSPSPATPNRTGNLIPGGLYSEFGGSIGGPAIKDRAFFFGDYQGQRQRQGISGTQTVPTTLLLNTCLGTQVGPSGIAGWPGISRQRNSGCTAFPAGAGALQAASAIYSDDCAQWGLGHDGSRG
jgi:hypothetical protein